MELNPYQASQEPIHDGVDRCLELMKAQRGLLVCAAFRLGSESLLLLAIIFTTQLGLSLAVVVQAIASCLTLYWIWRLAGSFTASPFAYFRILPATLLPWMGTLIVLFFSNMAIERLRRYGVRVGFFGVSNAQIQARQARLSEPQRRLPL